MKPNKLIGINCLIRELSQMKNKYMMYGMSIGMSIGAGLGISLSGILGIEFFSIFSGAGLAIGIGVGVALDKEASKRDPKDNED